VAPQKQQTQLLLSLLSDQLNATYE